DPIVSRPENGFAIGKAIEMSDNAGEADALLVATGVATTAALEASKHLAEQNVRCRVLHVHTLKPLDADAIVAAARAVRLVVPVEEHSLIGGPASAGPPAPPRHGGRLPPLRPARA